MKTNIINLDELSEIGAIFKALSNGRHICRTSEPAIWYQLEQHGEKYTAVYESIGYELVIDRREFAWFMSEDGSQNMNIQSKKLAIFFLVIFDYQADSGRSLGSFLDWRIDRELLERAYPRHKDLLDAEDISVDEFVKLIEIATRNGFAIAESGHWKLLPATYRYLDHFEELSEHENDDPTGFIEEDELC